MKKFFSVFFLSFIFFSCSSAKLVSTTKIPKDKVTIYLNFDNTQSTVETTGFVSGNTFYASTDTASFNTLKNWTIAKDILTEKGYKITRKVENSDMILYIGCESTEIKTTVTAILVDSNTEAEYAVTEGIYGMGLDIKGDIKGALKNAIQRIPNKKLNNIK